jgi:Ca2+-binding EF-hand superfamily protein
MPFKPEDKELISKHKEELTENTTNIESLFDELKLASILTEEDIADVMKKKTSKAKNIELYDILVKKDSRGFDLLVKALRKFGQSELADLLSPKPQESQATKEKNKTSEKAEESSDDEEIFNPAAELGMRRTKENVDLLRKKFKEFDSSGDGKISQDEFYQLMGQFGFERIKSEKHLRAHDKNSDGQLDFIEFCEMFFAGSASPLCQQPDFFVTHAMKVEIIRILEKDKVLAERWSSILEEIVPVQFQYDVSKKRPLFNLISEILNHWTSNESDGATYDRLCQIIKKESPNCARILKEQKEAIAKL